ncbi:NAD-dependent histone deacetylase SIR2 [Cryptococcus neoformans D17-1]|nr:NAD-dependent histone deacetylase SIR2 [Cryptococcus neoformans var. grubii D17-1]
MMLSPYSPSLRRSLCSLGQESRLLAVYPTSVQVLVCTPNCRKRENMSWTIRSRCLTSDSSERSLKFSTPSPSKSIPVILFPVLVIDGSRC